MSWLDDNRNDRVHREGAKLTAVGSLSGLSMKEIISLGVYKTGAKTEYIALT